MNNTLSDILKAAKALLVASPMIALFVVFYLVEIR